MVTGAREKFFFFFCDERGKKESFYHVLQKHCEAISQYSVSLPTVLLLPFSSQPLEPSAWKEVFQFRLCVTRKQCVCCQGDKSATEKLKSMEHLCPELDEEDLGLVLVQGSATLVWEIFAFKNQPISINQCLPEPENLKKITANRISLRKKNSNGKTVLSLQIFFCFF